MSGREWKSFTAQYFTFTLFYAVVLVIFGYTSGDAWIQQFAWIFWVPHAVLSFFLYSDARHNTT